MLNCKSPDGPPPGLFTTFVLTPHASGPDRASCPMRRSVPFPAGRRNPPRLFHMATQKLFRSVFRAGRTAAAPRMPSLANFSIRSTEKRRSPSPSICRDACLQARNSPVKTFLFSFFRHVRPCPSRLPVLFRTKRQSQAAIPCAATGKSGKRQEKGRLDGHRAPWV